MIIGLLALLFCLKIFLVLCVVAILAIGADYVYYEIQEAQKRRPQKPVSQTPTIDMLINNPKAQRRHRDNQEEAAWEGFFDTTYIRGFETNGALRSYGVKAPSRKAFTFFKLMDELADKVVQDQKDAAIFENTEEF